MHLSLSLSSISPNYDSGRDQFANDLFFSLSLCRDPENIWRLFVVYVRKVPKGAPTILRALKKYESRFFLQRERDEERAFFALGEPSSGFIDARVSLNAAEE